MIHALPVPRLMSDFTLIHDHYCTLEDFTPAIDMSHGRVSPHHHHFHARSCQNFEQKFSVFLVQIDIVQKPLTLQKQIIPHLKALISWYLDF